ncbi:MAG: ComEC/Rec2 family competence protein [bacterium]|nr:ComEC/Rec2 family competence protein [bacterium]
MLNSKSQIFFYSGLAFVAGILLRTFVQINADILLVGVFVILITILIFKKYRVYGFLILCLLLGMLRFDISDKNEFLNQHISNYNNQFVELIGVIKTEPDVREDHEKIVIATKQLIINDTIIEGQGKLLVKKYLYPSYQYGDKLRIKCDIQSPEPIVSEDSGRIFYYDKYLAKDDIYSVCYYPQIEYISSGHGNFIQTALLNIKHNFISQEQKIINDPYASFLGGLIWGAKKSIPNSLMEKFNVTGTTHIVALSGYNITIIAVLVLNICKALWVPRKYGFWISVLVILFFILITGAQASVVRAGIMGTMVLVARQTRRIGSMRNLLALSAVVMLLVNPKLLVYDAGFQLSFLATIGLIYLAPLIKKGFMWVTSAFEIRENLVATVSATIITLPLIMFQFGRLSVVAILVNILILPVIPLAMGIGFITIFLGYLWLEFAKAISGVVWLVLKYVIEVVEFFAQFKFASFDIQSVGWVIMLASYCILFSIIFLFHKYATKEV